MTEPTGGDDREGGPPAPSEFVRRLVRRQAQRPPAVLWRPLDLVAERWARLAPRGRLACWALLLVAAAVLYAGRVARADDRWGGTPVTVLVAAEPLPAGVEQLELLPRPLPPAAVPPGAVQEVPEDASLAYALPAGSVLTAAHLDVQGPAVGLAEGMRALPLAVDEDWGVVAGGFVDLLAPVGEGGSERLAASRPVLEVRGDRDRRTALVGLDEKEVEDVTAALELGHLAVTHAPPPTATASEVVARPSRPPSRTGNRDGGGG